MTKTGILGGSFDPVHLGHTGVALAALEELGLDSVEFIPTFIQPFKQERKAADAADRLEMLERAIMPYDRFRINTAELDRGKVSYTYETLKAVKEARPDEQFFFIMGSDSIMTVETWYRGEDLMKLCDIVCGLRETVDRKEVKRKAAFLTKKYGVRVHLLEKPMLPISSTMIRNLLDEERPISGLVDPAVEQYIYRKRLYAPDDMEGAFPVID